MSKQQEEMSPIELIEKSRKLEVTTNAAMIAAMAVTIDREILDEIIAEEGAYQAIEPMFDPTAWMKEHKSREAVWAVLRAVRNLIKVIDEVKNKDGRPELPF